MHLAKAPNKLLLAVSLLPLLLSACAAPASKMSAVSDEFAKPVAKVNGTAITRRDLDRAMKLVLANKPGLVIPPLLTKEFEKQTLNQLISTQILYEESQKIAMKDLDRQVQEKVAQIKKSFGTPESFALELKKISLDEEGFLDSTRRDLSIAYLINTRVATGIEVSDEEAKKFYDGNPEKFHQPEMVRVSHILVGVDSTGGAEGKKAARARAEKLRQEILAGAEFATVARENSSCPSGKKGGDLGYFPKGRMEPAFEKAAFALQAGAVSEVVETIFGFHIIKGADHRKEESVGLADAKEQIKTYLKGQKISAASEAFASAARKSAKVEIFL